jgi:hypothetical protein
MSLADVVIISTANRRGSTWKNVFQAFAQAALHKGGTIDCKGENCFGATGRSKGSNAIQFIFEPSESEDVLGGNATVLRVNDSSVKRLSEFGIGSGP